MSPGIALMPWPFREDLAVWGAVEVFGLSGTLLTHPNYSRNSWGDDGKIIYLLVFLSFFISKNFNDPQMVGANKLLRSWPEPEWDTQGTETPRCPSFFTCKIKELRTLVEHQLLISAQVIIPGVIPGLWDRAPLQHGDFLRFHLSLPLPCLCACSLSKIKYKE